MKSFALLADPVRRRIVEVLAEGEASAGSVGRVVQGEFGISQPAVSNHLRILRDFDTVTARREGSQRVYALAPGALDDVTTWVQRYSALWTQRLDALDTELARGATDRTPPTKEA